MNRLTVLVAAILFPVLTPAAFAQPAPDMWRCPNPDLEFLDAVAPVAIALNEDETIADVAAEAYRCERVFELTPFDVANELVFESAPGDQSDNASEPTDRTSQSFLTRIGIGIFMTERRSVMAIRSIPDGADIFFLNQPFGTTNSQFAVQNDAVESFNVTKDGYRDCNLREGAKVTTSGDKVIVDCNLKPTE